MANFATKEQTLATRSHRRTSIVDVPELGYSYILLELSGKERDAFEASLINRAKNGSQQGINLQNLRAKLVARSVVNPEDFNIEEHNGVAISATLLPDHKPTRMFNEIEANDLGDISASALQRLFKAAQALSGISEDDVEEMVGDLKNDQNGVSGTS